MSAAFGRLWCFWATLHGLPSLPRQCTVGIDRDPPASRHIQGDVTAECQPFVVGVVLKSCGPGRGRRSFVLMLFLHEDDPHCTALLLRTFLGFDLRLVRLVLFSVFRSSSGPPVSFRLRTNFDVRFDSLDFVST